MLKKYAMKVSNTLNAINNMKPTKTSSRRSSTTDEDEGSACSCDCDYNLTEVNRDLFIENYLIGRGASKVRSNSLTSGEDAMKEATLRKNNNRRKSLMERHDNRLRINRNYLFGDKADKTDRAVTRHKIVVNICRDDEEFNDIYGMDDKKSGNCEFIETSAPTSKKINNNLKEFFHAELVFCSHCFIYILMYSKSSRRHR